MRCDEFEARWHDELDRRIEPTSDAELALHVETCAGCRSWATALRCALRDLEALPKPVLRHDLAQRVLAELASPDAPSDVVTASIVELPSQRSAVAQGRAWQWWATAAVLLLSVVPLWRWSVGNREVNSTGGGIAVGPGTATPVPSLGEHVVIHPAPSPNSIATTKPPQTESAPTWNDVAEGLCESARQLADNTRRSLHDAFALASLWESKQDVKPTDTEGSWYRGVAEGVAPLTDSTLGTLNLLRGLVPTDKEASL